ncbi:LIM domain transcription factor LMO4.1 [Austrofundulus limnaeus]|uniref:LIM domain transcription factor LMO4.1 n=1 Tax=Austrofundulus limnaeus TaxID=52670 RepID=A0A2I4D0S1_AUSLI|nr:PREDICTED: LIM domain transcription factor LMO4.1-like [Austrofundulus limnaeus]
MVNSRAEPPVMGGARDGGGPAGGRSCAGCGVRILDRFLLFSMERFWHTHCLRCSCCHAPLGQDGSSCYSKAGMILCRDDYLRLFGHSGSCSACGQSIPASELVMRAQSSVYHLKVGGAKVCDAETHLEITPPPPPPQCFTCSTCRTRLVPGDRFHYINGTIFCELDRPAGVLLGPPTVLQPTGLMTDQKMMDHSSRTRIGPLSGGVDRKENQSRGQMSACS